MQWQNYSLYTAAVCVVPGVSLTVVAYVTFISVSTKSVRFILLYQVPIEKQTIVVR